MVHVQAILNANKINFQIITPETHINSAYGQANSQPSVIEVPEEQYEIARKLVYDKNTEASEMVDPMKDYTIEELKDIILNPEEWHDEFITSAKKILNGKGIEVGKNEIDQNTHQKTDELRKGKVPSKSIYYSMWFFALVGVYFGVVAGYFYWRGKVNGPDGKKYYMYSEAYREKGYYMFMMGG